MREIIAKSIAGRDLVVNTNFKLRSGFASLGNTGGTLLIGGTHGDEKAGTVLLENFVQNYLDSGRIPEATAILCVHNPDGLAADSRYNARGVDLNRNFPHRWSTTSDEPPGHQALSEPEAVALHAFITAYRPAKIVSLHWALSEIDADGTQSIPLAKAMWNSLSEEERRPYRLRIPEPDTDSNTLGFCPGSLGQWCGYGLIYPDGSSPAMVTLELPYQAHFYTRPDTLPADHLDRVSDLWRSRSDAYLAGVQAPVHRMLESACRFSASPNQVPFPSR